MAKTKISEFNANPALNTDIDSINLAEGCAPSGINDAIRELMSQLKDWQSGTSNDPMVIGSSGSLTLNQGTANGVAYLNGSKVVTSGSALTFDGTNLVVGYSSAGNVIAYSGGSLKVNRADNATNNEIKYVTSGDLFYFNQANGGAYQFNISGSEQMRLTSTGLGIGTSSPTNLLTVGGSVRGTVLVKGTNGASPYIALDHTATSGGRQYNLYAGGVNAGEFNIYDITAGANRVTLDSSGNLGLGVTPSAWSGSWKAFQVGSRVNLTTNGTDAIFTNNAYNSGSSWIYQNSSTSQLYLQGSGQHAWYNAASGTAGNAITFTQALTLTADGDLCVSTTSKVYEGKVSVSFNGNAGSGDQGIALIDTNASLNGDYALFVNSSGNVAGRITHNGTTTVAYTTSSDYRLKDITGPITNSGAYIDSLNPVEGTWKSDGATFVGLIAHEVQEASRTPIATGTKDGSEMQGMDYSSSELIANLIAEVKSLRQRVATLEAK